MQMFFLIAFGVVLAVSLSCVAWRVQWEGPYIPQVVPAGMISTVFCMTIANGMLDAREVSEWWYSYVYPFALLLVSALLLWGAWSYRMRRRDTTRAT